MKILAMIDIQNDFIDGTLGTPEAQAIMPKVLDKLNNCEYDTYAITLDTHTKDYLSTLEGQKLPVEHCIENTYGHKLNENLRKTIGKVAEGNCMIIRKCSFGSLRLPTELEGCFDYVSEIEISISSAMNFERRTNYENEEKRILQHIKKITSNETIK